MEALNNLDIVLRTLWFIAIPSSLIFIIQTVMTFIGADATDGLEADFDGDLSGADAPFQLFSFRNLINFLLGFSWTGISLYSTVTNTSILVVLSVAVGALFVYAFFMIIGVVQKLAEDNSFRLDSTLHNTAEVYLTIPGNKTGKGKILISVKGAFHELEAMTENDTIQTGSFVKVVRIEHKNILIVETI
ncbi:MAG TPA: hypothetical protein VK147_09080 [Candidatus Didemnitutus sp.]|nr:hypothetical protein [Candidatus Didemnitutus sp.]